MFSVNQPWDPLKVCVVGRSYPPEFYQWVESNRLRSMFEQIARETEEDYQGIIKTLESFGVEVLRPNVPNIPTKDFFCSNSRIPGPVGMTPRDRMIMIGQKLFMFPGLNHVAKVSGHLESRESNWNPRMFHVMRGTEWPEEFRPWNELPAWIRYELTQERGFVYDPGEDFKELSNKADMVGWWTPVRDRVRSAGNNIYSAEYFKMLDLIPANGITRIGRDLYFGWNHEREKDLILEEIVSKYFQDYRCHFVWTGGHIDGVFSPIVPGLVVSTEEIDTFDETFPGWEVVHLPNESFNKVKGWTELKRQNQGRWWLKDAHKDPELIDFVDHWLQDWTGFVQESVFDVNMLAIDEKNVIVHSMNETVARAFDKRGITAHVCPFRHRYFWDGGIHCVTLDLHREGEIRDYFPERK